MIFDITGISAGIEGGSEEKLGDLEFDFFIPYDGPYRKLWKR